MAGWYNSRTGQQQDQDQAYQYKDRAKERRKKFGKEELPPENKFKDKYMAAMADVAASGAPAGADAPKLDDSNLGNRMLQKMGWKDGLGLGKKNQGRTEIIQTQSRMAQSGLGTSQPSLGPNDSYKDVARKPCGTDTMTRATELPNYILLLGGDITLSTQEFCDFASAELCLLPFPV